MNQVKESQSSQQTIQDLSIHNNIVNVSILLFFILGWWGCFILYPQWYLPGRERLAFLFLRIVISDFDRLRLDSSLFG